MTQKTSYVITDQNGYYYAGETGDAVTFSEHPGDAADFSSYDAAASVADYLAERYRGVYGVKVWEAV